jgi:hypothetical protein
LWLSSSAGEAGPYRPTRFMFLSEDVSHRSLKQALRHRFANYSLLGQSSGYGQ